ncbi:hypothetical protein H9P43_007847 [Blastocladiella emersonii ATCC 22665]|nr:hypothetical protein H9P43_007847 [Blastocladiella emersonii ATCC 22665]
MKPDATTSPAAAEPIALASPSKRSAPADDAAAAEPAKKRTKRNKSVATKTDTNTIPIHRGKFKLRYMQKHAFLTRRADPAVGVLVSCSPATETRALGQVRKYMDEFIVQAFPDVKPVYSDLRKEEDEVEVLGEEPKAEEGEAGEKAKGKAKDEKEPPTSLFQFYDSGCAGLLFLRFRNSVDPHECVGKLFDHVRTSERKSEIQSTDLSHCHRFLPIQHVCSAATEHDIETSFGPLLAALPGDRSVAIVFESRNCPAIKRASVVPKLAAHLPRSMKVDLANPDVVVLVSVFKSVAGLAVVEGDEFRATHRFNLQQL